MNVQYDIRQAPTLQNFLLDNSFMRAVMGPFGSGKSSACCAEIVRRGHEQKPGADGKRRTRWAVVRNTFRMLEDTTIKTFLMWFPPGDAGDYRASSHDFFLKIGKDVEIEINFRALDRPEHVKNLLSLEVTGAWFNEVREIPWAIVEAMTGRVGRYPAKRDGGPTWYGILMDTNPPDIDSRFARFFEGEEAGKPRLEPDHEHLKARVHGRIFKQPSGLSPMAENLKNLPGGRAYYTNMMAGKSSEFIKVYVEGQYGFFVEGRPVYGNDYDDSVHCMDFEHLKGVTIDRGWDFGLTPACVLTQVSPMGQWLVFDEIVGDGIGLERFKQLVHSYCNSRYPGHYFTDTGDPAGQARSQTDERTCFAILESPENGGEIRIAAGEVTPAARIESVRRPLNTRKGFLLHPRCKVLRKGFMGGYQFKRLQVSEERYEEKPLKNEYSHPHDALQYVASRIFGSKIMYPEQKETRARTVTDFDIFAAPRYKKESVTDFDVYKVGG